MLCKYRKYINLDLDFRVDTYGNYFFIFTGNCRLPEGWKGKWFQSGLNQHSITIDGKSIGSKGICTESSADKFLFYDA